MVQDVLYAAAAWMQRSDNVQGRNGRKRAAAFPTLPPSMAVVCRLCIVTGM